MATSSSGGLSARLMMMAAQAAVAVARFQHGIASERVLPEQVHQHDHTPNTSSVAAVWASTSFLSRFAGCMAR